MRLVIADPGLYGDRGHHANGCRYILAAARKRGVRTKVLAYAKIEGPLKAELEAEPVFREYTYQFNDGDPYVGWLTAFHRVANATREDLAALSGYGADDIFYIQGAQPAQLMAAIDWAASLPEHKCPQVIVELGSDAGVKVEYKGSDLVVGIPNPQGWGGRPTLFRFVASCMAKLGRRPFFVVTYDTTVSKIYSVLMGQPVGVVPFAVGAHGDARSRSGHRPITVGALGHQQISKGYHLLPEVIKTTLNLHEHVRFLVHNSDPDQRQSAGPEEMRRTQEALRKMVNGSPRITLKEGTIGFSEWNRLLASIDVLLCPYDPVKYGTGHSGLIASALASGIPFIVPAGTVMSKQMEEFGCPGAAFEHYAADSVGAALHQVLDAFDMYADRAQVAARKWAATQGPENFLDLLLKLKADPNACYRVAQTDTLQRRSNTEGMFAADKHKAGQALAFNGKAVEALQDFDEALRHCPTFAEAWASRAAILAQMGRDAEAYDSYAQAIILTPLYESAALRLKDLAEKLGRPAQLLTPWAENPAPTLASRVSALFRRNKELPAEESDQGASVNEGAIRMALLNSPCDPSLAVALSKALKASGRSMEAKCFLHYALRLAPWDESIESFLNEVSGDHVEPRNPEQTVHAAS